jgi:sigma-B regulation protein RsbU (phosphoserine phosphatase)
MCVPLIHQDQTFGILYGDRISTSTAYTNEDIDFFAGIAQQVSIGLINCRLMAEQERMIQLSRELDLARQIQTALFPTTMPHHDQFKVAAINDPGARVSGDYYDVIEREDGRVWCLVADVTGEGVAAALLMANLQAAVRVTIDETDDPAILLSRWNQLICRNTDSSKFITCLLALVDPQARTVRLGSAGHCPPLVLRSGHDAPEEVRAESGLPLGVLEEVEYTSTSVDLGREPAAVLCYTDGVIEAMNGEGHMFGTKRMHDAFLEVATESSPQSIVKHLRKHVARFTAGASQSDDITLLAARIG